MEALELTERERNAYGEIFSSCDVEGTGKISGSKASELFFTSGLSKAVLQQITELCGAKRLGHFGRSQFYIALRLIALGQAGLPITLENSMQCGSKLSLPRFGVKNEESMKSEPMEKRRPSGSGSGLPPPPNKQHVRRTSGQNILNMMDSQPLPPRISSSSNGGDLTTQPPPPPPKMKPVGMPVVPEPCEQPPPSKLPLDLADRDAAEAGQQELEQTPTPSDGPSSLGVPGGGVSEWAHFSDADEDRGLLTGGRVGAASHHNSMSASHPSSHAEWQQFSETESGLGLWRTGSSGRRRGKAAKAGVPGVVSQSSSTPSSSDSEEEDSDDEDGTENGTDVDEAVWCITGESQSYYEQQFLKLQPNPCRHVGGSMAKDFFELSKLPPTELSKIWELSDVDRDGQLNLQEFCIAMHLVVLRRNNVPIPDKLPACLAPYSMLENAPDDPFGPELSASDEQPGSFWSQPMHVSQPTSSSSSIHNFQAAGPPSGAIGFDAGGPSRRMAPVPPAQSKLESSSSDISTPSDKLINFDLKPLDPNMPHPVAKKPHPLPASVEASTRPRPAPRSNAPPAGPSYALGSCLLDNGAGDDAAPPPPPPRTRCTSQPPPPPPLPASHEELDSRPPVARLAQPIPQPPSSALFAQGSSAARDRKELLTAIRAVKEKNHSLVRLNNELNYELKEIQEQRIGLEIQLEHLRPFHG